MMNLELASLLLLKMAKGGHGRPDVTPELVDHVAARIAKEHPEYTKSQAYAIAVKQLQRYGYLRKGSMKLTGKGRKRSAYHGRHRRAMDLKKRSY